MPVIVQRAKSKAHPNGGQYKINDACSMHIYVEYMTSYSDIESMAKDYGFTVQSTKELLTFGRSLYEVNGY